MIKTFRDALEFAASDPYIIFCQQGSSAQSSNEALYEAFVCGDNFTNICHRYTDKQIALAILPFPCFKKAHIAFLSFD